MGSKSSDFVPLATMQKAQRLLHEIRKLPLKNREELAEKLIISMFKPGEREEVFAAALRLGAFQAKIPHPSLRVVKAA